MRGPTESRSGSRSSPPPPPLQIHLSWVWDFGGQQEYYNNHHYFLSARSIFLVVWKVTEHMSDLLGLGGLEFWLKSLKAHLPPPSGSKPLYSIVVVGTHIDGLVDHKESRGLRRLLVEEMFSKKCRMGDLPFEYLRPAARLVRTSPRFTRRSSRLLLDILTWRRFPRATCRLGRKS